MKKIFIGGITAAFIAGCINITNVDTNPSPAVSGTPGPAVSPSSTATASGSPAVSPAPSASPAVTATGILEGKLTIGPLCPVEPCSVSDEQKQQAYAARKIQIFAPDGKTLVKEITADYKTESYRTELAAGRYLLNVTNAGLPGSFSPREVIIAAGKTTVLDLDIDTGIR